MPAMTDPCFARSVTFICEHNEDGAMGVVVNRPIDMKLTALFDQINIPQQDGAPTGNAVHFGGPVQTDRGFVLHRPAGSWNSTISIQDDTALTTSKDVLEALARGQGPEKFLVTLGYAGWTAGQLEQELARNTWLTVKPENSQQQDKVIFDLPNEEKLTAAMRLLGIDFATFSETAGHA